MLNTCDIDTDLSGVSYGRYSEREGGREVVERGGERKRERKRERERERERGGRRERETETDRQIVCLTRRLRARGRETDSSTD